MGEAFSKQQPNLFHVLGLFGRFFRLERRILALVVSYSIVIGLFSLIVPLTVQELVNTFSFAIQPVMIATLAIIMVVVLAFVGVFKTLLSGRRLPWPRSFPIFDCKDSDPRSRTPSWKHRSCSVRCRSYLWIWSM